MRTPKPLKRFIGAVLLSLAGLGLTACASAIPKQTMERVDRSLDFQTLRKDPNAVKGRWVLLGGVIVATTNRDQGTVLEIYQTRLDWIDRPTETDTSGGRFLALYDGFLDADIYAKGRKVTLAGPVEGSEVRRLDEMDYRYPLVRVRSLNLWEREPRPAYGYPYGYPWYDPWYGPYGPWYGPYGRYWPY